MRWFLLETRESARLRFPSEAQSAQWWLMGRRLLQQLIIDGEKSVGGFSPCRRIKAIGPLGGARSEQQYIVLEA